MKELWRGLWANVLAGTRLALFLPVRITDFRISGGQYAAVLGASFVAWLAGGMLRQGFPGTLDIGALTVGLAQIPLVLVVCLLAAALLRNSAYTLAFALVFTASDPLFEVAALGVFYAAQQEAAAPYAEWMNALFVLWAWVIVLRAQRVVSGWQGRRSWGAAGLFTALLLGFVAVVPRTELWVAVHEPVGEPGVGLLREEVFHQQAELLVAQLATLEPERGGVEDLYFVGAASYGLQDTFLKELESVRELMAARFDTGGRSVVLANHASTLERYPLATTTNLRAGLEHLGRVINPEEDVVMLFITTHGSSDGVLSFEMPPLALTQLNPTLLARMLADSGIKWKIIVISACYSGRFVEPLRDDTSLIITASDADHSSFGCEFDSDITWFGQAYFMEGLAFTRSFTDAFDRARAAVAAREQAAGYEPSNPQIHLGKAMKEKLQALEKRLEAGDSGSGGPR